MKKRIIIPVVAIAILLTTASFKNDFFEIAKQIEIFTTMFKELNMNYVDEVTPATLMDKAIKGMLEDLDPYTVYWNEQEVQDARIKNSGTYTGIGASVRTLKDKIVVVEPFKGYPADEAGLKAGDEIIKIGNTVLSDFDDDAGELLKGASGTSVELTFLRQGKTQSTSLTRKKVAVKAVPFYKLLDDNIGYIVLTKFNRKTTIETKAALEELKADGATKIILDLRGNPGGLLNEAINIVNLFVPKGEVITTTKSVIEKYNKTYSTRGDPVDTEIPLVVLVNGRSASASEIVSGGLQDLDRAVIVGARSFGKGLVQRPKKLTYGTQLKVTISRYYTPSGRCIQALDYWNRDENGDPIRLDPKEYNSFKTKGGRTVYDGGGILPDIEVETAQFSPITTALLKDNAIFDYATKYYYKNEMADWADFKFSEADFQDFLKFLKQNDFSYETQTEKEFAEALRRSEDDDLKKEIESSYRQLKASIDSAKDKALVDKKAEIMSLLSDEILKRYFYREGLYNYQVKNNSEILTAIEVLNDANRYSRILK
ncbi:MAG: S41 family peptidase [Bacteroidia bacterium]|nr:S41 family peptidase [Bacteroidia bacterium]NNF31475.1 S41 family peptidase [Flavobacteriaceae bacterium]MBT8275550.1 S41 family peptidase [Bacteroidia bacterium]NNJ82050.1 S41 family peptidase [Flavobacteriaceae bacterium]NNK54054.1 S41 family peptidase [Flavobacteriaceae bacterium]